MDPDADAQADGRNETANERADRNWSELLQELRATQTGTQLISGFLLAVAFQSRFTDLDEFQLAVYLTLVGLAASATLVGLALVTVHRIHFAKRVKSRIVTIGNRLLVVNLVLVVLLTAGVTGLIFDFTLSRVAGIIAFGVTLVLAAGMAVLLLPIRDRTSRSERP